MNLDMAVWDTADSDQSTLSLRKLSDWSKGDLRKLLHEGSCPVGELESIWLSLLTTLRCPSLSEKHITAASNALYVFLQCSLTSAFPEVKKFVLSETAWLACFAAIRARWQLGKAKPLLQILEMLVAISKERLDGSSVSSMIGKICSELSTVILTGQPRQDLRTSLAMLSFLLERNALSYVVFYDSIRECLAIHQMPLSRRLRANDIDRDVFIVSKDFVLLSFLSALLLALQQQDTRIPAARCFKIVLERDASSQFGPEPDGLELSLWPLLATFLTSQPMSLEGIASEIFPILCKQSPQCLQRVLNSKAQYSENITMSTRLAILQFLREENAVAETELPQLLQTATGNIAFGEPADAMEYLLLQADDELRVRALRLVTTSTATNAPITPLVMAIVERNLPCWFQTGGSHERSETLGILKKFIFRVRGGAATLQKDALTSPEARSALQKHSEFMHSLTSHLISDMAPNASYQRHIMSLHLFRYLLLSGIDKGTLIKPPTPNSRELTQETYKLGSQSKHRKVMKALNHPSWSFSVCLRGERASQELLNLLLDPFEDVRALSADILQLLLAETQSETDCHLGFSGKFSSVVQIMTGRTEALAARTNRSDHADGLGRMYSLLARLDHMPCGLSMQSVLEFYSGQQAYEASLDEAHGDNGPRSMPAKKREYEVTVAEQLTERLEAMLASTLKLDAAGTEPLHGMLLGLMYCIKASGRVNLDRRMIGICRRVWDSVEHILCIDSPERAEEDDEEELDLGPKDLLSFSWRALRDSSLLLRTILDLSHSAGPVQRLQLTSQIGNMSAEQLTKLRHRGVFSTVAQTFATCCRKAVELEGAKLSGLRFDWYQFTINQIEKQGDRLTRRSAGLPAMMSAVLCPDHFESFASFIKSFSNKVLAPINPTTVLLPQVHAMNCLREVTIDSRFRTAVAPHVPRLLSLAARSFGSENWAIRNCGLMLFRACVARLGQSDNALISENVSVRPEESNDIFRVAVDLLSSDHTLQEHNLGARVAPKSTDTERVFAALDLIAHLSPPVSLQPLIKPLLLKNLNSPVWSVRERAAQVLAVLIPEEQLASELGEIIGSIDGKMLQNELHGTLLYCRQLLKRNFTSSSTEDVVNQVPKFSEILKMTAKRLPFSRCSFPVQAVFIEMINDLIASGLRLKMDIGTLWISLANHVPSPSQMAPLLNRAVLYNDTLRLIFRLRTGSMSGERPNELTVVQRAFSTDNDAAKDLLERLVEQEACLDIPLQFFGALVFEDSSEDVTALFLDLLTKSLSKKISSDSRHEVSMGASQSLKDLDLEVVKKLFKKVCSLMPHTRDLMAAKMVTEAFLATFFAGQGEDDDIWKQDCGQTSWVYMVQKAALDDTDPVTRHRAAEAISVYLPRLGNALPDRKDLGLLMALYDLLNDDDVDVRILAAETASAFLSIRIKDRITERSYCPYAAAQRLRSYLLDFLNRLEVVSNKENSSSTTRPVKRVIGAPIDVDLLDFCHKNPVVLLVKHVENSIDALFAEERQNLYIDDLSEIKFWSDVSKSTCCSLIGSSDLLRALEAWIIDGLSTIRTLLDGPDEYSLLPTLTFKPEILLLCVRVVETANIFLFQFHSQVFQHHTIRRHLRALREMGGRRHLHRHLQRSLDDACRVTAAPAGY